MPRELFKAKPARTLLFPCLVALSGGCEGTAGHGPGDARVLVSAEESITMGLDPGSAEGNTVDYAVRFDKYLVAIGNVELSRSSDGERFTSDGSVIVNMLEAGSEGLEIQRWSDVPSGVWDKFGFETPRADDATQKGPRVSDEEHAAMVEAGLTYWIAGRVLRPDDEGGPVHFEIRAEVPTRYSECTYEGEPGLSVVEGGTRSATITMHGDHLFFSSFPAANEQTVRRRAGWIVDADLDQDGSVDNDELMRADATLLFTEALGYSLAGAPIDILSGFDFARAQLATQGHFRGEGECLWNLLE